MTSIPHVIGRFEVVGQIGRGGLGALYRAWDPQLERPIAIRILGEDNEELPERFRRAARSAASLRHPHIVTNVNHVAPEHVAGESVDARSDVFAVGGVFYE